MTATSPAEWVRALEERGVELWVEGDRLRFRAPVGALTPEARAAVSAQRAGICAELRARAAASVRTAPLSFSQQSLWFIQQQAPRSAAYHVGIAARVLSEVDVPALEGALQALVDRHASLRTTYPLEEGGPVQRVAGAARLALEVHEVPGLDEAGLRAAVQADHDRPFDLERGPVIRASLHRRGPADHVLLVNVHHIAADGWSLLVLLDELSKLYAEATGGPAAALARPAVEYADHARWQEEHLAGPAGERLWSYWQRQLAGLPRPVDLPADRPRPPIKTFRGDSVPVALPPALVERLKELARQEGTTAFVVLLACFHALLHRLTGAEDVVVGTPTFARGRPELLGVVGDFVNSVALRGHPGAGTPFRALVRELREVVIGAIDAEEMPLPLLVQRLHVERDSSRSPLFETFFLMQRFDQFRDLQRLISGSVTEEPVELGGLRLVPYVLHQQEGQFDLSLHLVERQGSVSGAFRYGTDLFEAATVRRWAEGFVALAEVAAADPDVKLGELPAPAVAERPGAAAQALLARLRGLDVKLRLEGGKLRVNAPKGALDDELKGLIAASRDELVRVLGEAGAGAGPALRPVPRDGPLPISSAQQRLWFLDRMDPGRSHYNMGLNVVLRGRLDVALLKRALDALERRHEALRTRVGEQGGAPLLELLPPAGAVLELDDLAERPDAGDEALRRATAFVQLPYDVARGPLGRFRLARFSPDEHLLTFALHHIVGDGWSQFVLVRDLCGIYDALAAGRPLPPPLPLQYVDYAGWERARLAKGDLGAHLAWWKAELEGAPGVLELPTDRPRPATPSLRGRRVRFEHQPGLLEQLKALGRRQDATLYMTLLAAVQVVLARYAGQDDLVLGSPMANRESPDLEGVVGCFVNNVMLRGRLGDDPTFTELVARAKRSTLGAFDHQALPFDLLVDGLRPERSSNHAPLFQVLFALQSFPTDVQAPAGLAVQYAELPDTGGARFDLAIELVEFGGKLHASYEYSTDLFDPGTIERLNGHLGRLLAAAVAAPDTRVKALPLLTPEDEQLLLRRVNDTALEHDRRRCVHHLLEATARARPDAPAIVAGDVTLSYAELDARANRLARLLAARGVKRGDLVAVCLDRTWEIPVALAAVHKAGAAYVPLDPAYPADRLRYVLEDAGAACAVTLSRFAPLLEDGRTPLVALDALGEELAALSPAPFESPAAPEDRAYVIYTSGSTGRPKGVEVEHRNVVAFVEAMAREPGCGPSDVLLAVTTLSFDIAGLELWLPLATGARVVIASRTDVLDGERLISMLGEGVTILQATPATWRLLLDAGWSGTPGLKALCGGEALPRDLAAALLERVAELWNVYGPTETTIWSTIDRVTDASGPVTIGHPIANTRVYVLEPASGPGSTGQLAPVGVPGELVIAGEGVARGYHDRPELTAEKFVTIALPDGRSERAYRTGDVARFRADGRIDFLGRRDHQVKVRGHRIELGEIEAVLATHPGVKECVVVVREDTPGDQRLVGYGVQAPGAAFDPEAARGTLRAKLPEYMLPNLFHTLPALPLTPNGKIDRKALPRPEAPAAAPGAPDASEALFTPAQRRVATAWREVLRTERVGLHDNFFDLGGHSLLLVKLHASLRREFGVELGLVELFQWTTVAAQAARLTADAPDDSALRRAQARAARQTHV